MELDSGFAWLVITFVLFMAYTSGTSMSSTGFVQGFAIMLSAPLALLSSLGGAFPLLLPLGLLAMIYYFKEILGNLGGEGLTMLVLAAFIIISLGV